MPIDLTIFVEPQGDRVAIAIAPSSMDSGSVAQAGLPIISLSPESAREIALKILHSAFVAEVHDVESEPEDRSRDGRD